MKEQEAKGNEGKRAAPPRKDRPAQANPWPGSNRGFGPITMFLHGENRDLAKKLAGGGK